MKYLQSIFRLLLILALAAGTLRAQGTTATVHGSANDSLGILVTSGSVKLTMDKGKIDKNSNYLYSFEMDKDGNYKGEGITPGTYTLVLFRKNLTADFSKPVTLAAGQDTIVNFDMSRQEYIDKLSDDDKRLLEEFRKRNAAVSCRECRDQECECIDGRCAHGDERHAAGLWKGRRRYDAGDHGAAQRIHLLVYAGRSQFWT